MKNPNRIERKDNAARTPAQPSKKSDRKTRVRVGIRVPNALHAAIKEGARRTGLTISAFVEQAIREVLPLVEGNVMSQPAVRAISKGGAK